jgi:hypothetical protein
MKPTQAIIDAKAIIKRLGGTQHREAFSGKTVGNQFDIPRMHLDTVLEELSTLPIGVQVLATYPYTQACIQLNARSEVKG